MLRTLRLILALGLLVAACTTSSVVARDDLAVSRSTSVPRLAEPTREVVAPTAKATPSPTVTTTVPEPTLEPARPLVPPGLEPYAGLGAWVDVFDWAPLYAIPDGPSVTTDDMAVMAELGVTTVYLQTSRVDDIGTGPIESPEIIAELLDAAHEEGIAVVGWYLPRWEDAADDLARLIAIAEFDVDGQQFDGVAVDIEGVPKPEQRADWNRRLINLSRDLHDAVGSMALGAIVLPPTLIEVVNVEYWPDFPWAELAPFYDVWLPMSYWSFRSDDSPYSDGYAYNADSTERLRANVGDPDAVVHAIGGIGAITPDTDPDGEAGGSEPMATVAELDEFVRSLVETRAIGGSIYDWASMEAAGRRAMTNAMRGANLTTE